MSRAEKSHVPYVSGVPHPFHQVALKMVDSAGELARIRKNVQSNPCKITPTLIDFEAIKARLAASGDLAALKNIIRGALRKEKEPVAEQEMPAPPPASSLYGRVLKGEEFVDVGSGDAKRLIQFSGQFKPTTVDPRVEKTRIDAPHVQEVYQAQTEKPVTHFMAMCNNKDQSEFVESDGVGVVPDVPSLVELGYAESVGDAAITRGKGKQFVDYPCQAPTTKINNFYRGVNTYARRSAQVFSTETVVLTVKEMPSIGKRVTTLPAVPADCTLKYRGQQWKFRKKRNKAALITRSGNVHKALVAGDLPDLDLDFEMTIFGPRLIRVNLYHGVRPFHSGAALEYFCERVELYLDGMRLLAPEKAQWTGEELRRCDVEGYVYRDCGEDFLVRSVQAVDIRVKDLGRLVEELYESGLLTVTTGTFYHEPESIVEVEIVVENDTCHLECVNLRTKNRVDDISKVGDKLAWPTAHDLALLVKDGYEHDPLCFSEEFLDDEPLSDDE